MAKGERTDFSGWKRPVRAGCVEGRKRLLQWRRRRAAETDSRGWQRQRRRARGFLAKGKWSRERKRNWGVARTPGQCWAEGGGRTRKSSGTRYAGGKAEAGTEREPSRQDAQGKIVKWGPRFIPQRHGERGGQGCLVEGPAQSLLDPHLRDTLPR